MHEQFMLAALEQAKLGQGRCAPNPSVGAVAVKDGTIIAQAWHQGAGLAHAEQLLITQFPANTPGVTLYVTLEPCNHWGKTPPCTEAIIKQGVESVYFGYRDPNPLVACNDTPNTLRSHQISCQYLPLAEVDQFYESYHYWTKTGLPRLTAKIAQTLDGKIANVHGEPISLSNEACKTFTHQLRAKADVILTTARTIEKDNPRLNVRLEGQSEAKALAVLDQNLRLTINEQAFGLAKQVHVFHAKDLTPSTDSSSVIHHPVSLKGGRLDLKEILQTLGKLGYHDVFVEAGGQLFSALHKERLVHRSYIYIVPRTLQPEAVSAYSLDEAIQPAAKVSWQPMDDNMILCLDWREEACLPA